MTNKGVGRLINFSINFAGLIGFSVWEKCILIPLSYIKKINPIYTADPYVKDNVITLLEENKRVHLYDFRVIKDFKNRIQRSLTFK